MNKKTITKEMNKLTEKAHNNIDYETLIDYGLSEKDKNKYYELQNKLWELEK